MNTVANIAMKNTPKTASMMVRGLIAFNSKLLLLGFFVFLISLSSELLMAKHRVNSHYEQQ